MAKYPQKPEEIFEEFSRNLKEVFKEDLESIMLFGSAARGEYRPGKSDINFTVILSEPGIKRFYEAEEIVKKWQKQSVAVPLFLTEQYIEQSLDSFPVEFFNLKNEHKLVFGKELLDELEIARDDLRLQVEREMKGKLLNLRLAYFQTGGDNKLISQLIKDSFGAFLSLFPAILFLKNDALSTSSEENVNRIGLLFKLDSDLLKKLYKIKRDVEKLDKKEAKQVMQKYVAQIAILSNQIDSL